MLNLVFVTHKDNYTDEVVHRWVIEQLNSVTTELDLPQCEFGLICLHTDKDCYGHATDYMHTLVACKLMDESTYEPSKRTVFVFEGDEFGNCLRPQTDAGTVCIDRVLSSSGLPQEVLVGQKALRAAEEENYGGIVIVVEHPGMYVELFERSEAHQTNQLEYQKPLLH